MKYLATLGVFLLIVAWALSLAGTFLLFISCPIWLAIMDLPPVALRYVFIAWGIMAGIFFIGLVFLIAFITGDDEYNVPEEDPDRIG